MSQETDAEAKDAKQYLTFKLHEEEYGIDILKVQEIRGFEGATKIPNAPDYMLGVINLRGAVVPIVDLRARFKLDNVEYSKSTVTILVKMQDGKSERTIGMVVDAVSDVHAISADAIGDTPDLASNISQNFVTVLATMDENMIILLDIDALISEGILSHSFDAAASVEGEGTGEAVS